ncbi:MAG TPA: class I SAM-dependent methyltransferase, partial [Candidatus Wallbacteria bacterium]|nr:class I SAM-dependent methyltransferase [Candidatus Wallbacteria bacterium]
MKFFEPHESMKEFCKTSREYFFEGYQNIAREAAEWFGLPELSPEDRILEFGGGEGFISVFLSKLSPARFVYIDKNPHAAELARKNYEEAEMLGRSDIMVCEVEKAEIPENSIKFIVSRGTIQFTEYKKTLSNVVRWLAPGGIAFIGCGFGLNLTDEYRKKVNEFLAKKEKENIDTGSMESELVLSI